MTAQNRLEDDRLIRPVQPVYTSSDQNTGPTELGFALFPRSQGSPVALILIRTRRILRFVAYHSICLLRIMFKYTLRF